MALFLRYRYRRYCACVITPHRGTVWEVVTHYGYILYTALQAIKGGTARLTGDGLDTGFVSDYRCLTLSSYISRGAGGGVRLNPPGMNPLPTPLIHDTEKDTTTVTYCSTAHSGPAVTTYTVKLIISAIIHQISKPSATLLGIQTRGPSEKDAYGGFNRNKMTNLKNNVQDIQYKYPCGNKALSVD